MEWIRMLWMCWQKWRKKSRKYPLCCDTARISKMNLYKPSKWNILHVLWNVFAHSTQCRLCAWVCLLVTWPTTVDVAAVRALRAFNGFTWFVLTIHFANVVNVISESYKCFLIVYSIDDKKYNTHTRIARDSVKEWETAWMPFPFPIFPRLYIFCTYIRILIHTHIGNSHFTQLILVFLRKQMTYKVCDNRLIFLLQCWQYPLEMSKHVRSRLLLMLLLSE